MKNVQKIIELAGGLDEFKHVRLENKPYMRLVIEKLHYTGPYGGPVVSVAHYGEQNGDAMRDPEICYEVTRLEGEANWIFTPIYFLNDYAHCEQFIYRQDPNGQWLVWKSAERSAKSFSRTWNANIAAQGFVKIAKSLFTKKS